MALIAPFQKGRGILTASAAEIDEGHFADFGSIQRCQLGLVLRLQARQCKYLVGERYSHYNHFFTDTKKCIKGTS